MRDWWKTFFKPAIYPMADLVGGKETEKEILELLSRLPVPQAAKILDVACGLGRHSLSLARRGYKVTGVDYSSAYISEAKRRAQGLGRRAQSKNIEVEFLKRDMRHLGFDARFDAALNLWTSFGYFKKFQDDLLTLRQMFKALKPGGFIVIDVSNDRWIQRNFKPRDWNKTEQGWELEAHAFSGGADPAWTSRWVFIKNNGEISQGESFVRAYDRKRLKGILKRAGFSNIVMMGGLSEKRTSGAASKRIMALARKPG